MKNNKILTLYFLVATLYLVGCTDEILKSNYDYVPDASKLPKVTLSIRTIGGAAVTCTGNAVFGSDTTIIERGFVCSTDAEFKAGFISAVSDENIFSGFVKGLNQQTDYFAKAYVITRNGIAYSGLQTFKTRKLVNILDVNVDNLKDYSDLFSFIDKDGDKYGWELADYNEEKTQTCFVSYSWYNNKVLTPENYLLFPPFTFSSTVTHPQLTVSLEVGDENYPAEVFKIIASDKPITLANSSQATELYKGTLTKEGIVKTVFLPESLVGKTAYLGICHFDCTDNFALIYTGHKIVVSQ
ncbi:MAG: hypothetical protein Q7U47_05770 [Paludibacter sp.]|nr:hypothetical protein [Paludibacter sp.]